MMQKTYKISKITDAEIDRAHLLVHPLVPRLELGEWRAFCRDVPSGRDQPIERDDIVVAANQAGYIQGLSIHAIRRHLFHGRILDVSLLVVMSAADEAGIAAELLDYLKTLARQQACSAIRIWTLEKNNWSCHLSEQEVSRSDRGMLLVLDPDMSVETRSRLDH